MFRRCVDEWETQLRGNGNQIIVSTPSVIEQRRVDVSPESGTVQPAEV